MDEREKLHVTERFRALQKRSGLSYAKLATKIGLAGASSLQAYFHEEKRPAPYFGRDFVEKIDTALAGLGSPPITREEIYDLAGIPVPEGGHADKAYISQKLEIYPDVLEAATRLSVIAAETLGVSDPEKQSRLTLKFCSELSSLHKE